MNKTLRPIKPADKIAPFLGFPKKPDYYKEHMGYVDAFNRAVDEATADTPDKRQTVNP
jgi:hypothetical protein